LSPGFFGSEGVVSPSVGSSFLGAEAAPFAAEPFTGGFTGTFGGDPGFTGTIKGSPGLQSPITQGGGGFWDWFNNMDWRKRLQLAQLGLHGASTFSGLYNARQMQRLASEAANTPPQVVDPMGYGPRAQYLEQLNALMKDPSLLQSRPGYKAGQQAIERSLAAQGYMGSGNMMLALQDYGGKAFSDEVNRLSALAGANLPLSVSRPPIDAAVAAQGAKANITSQALATGGFALKLLELIMAG
jgi:hypothetical protein